MVFLGYRRQVEARLTLSGVDRAAARLPLMKRQSHIRTGTPCPVPQLQPDVEEVA